MPHPPGPLELATLEFAEDPAAANSICISCLQTPGDLVAHDRNGSVRSVCSLCFLLIDRLKMTKRLHPDDPAVCSAAARLGRSHADLRRAEGRRQRELSLAHMENDEGASTIYEYESLLQFVCVHYITNGY